MAYEELKNHGITSTTPENILLGAGTIHKGLTFNAVDSTWNFTASLIGATSGGSKVTIEPKIEDIEVDGAHVKVKGLAVKLGETAKMETNFVEITPEIIEMAVLGDSAASAFAGWTEIKSKANIATADYVTGLGYIGKTISGKPIIIIFDSALCTSGWENEGKDKDKAVHKMTFECYADLTSDLTTLPYHIYYPTPV